MEDLHSQNERDKIDNSLSTTEKNLLAQFEHLSRFLDSYIKIPILSYRIGFDGLLGLIPVVGDISSFGISLYTIYLAGRLGARTTVLLKMISNLLVDLIIGGIPIIGDFFDLTYKANQKNSILLKSFLDEKDDSSIRANDETWKLFSIIFASFILLIFCLVVIIIYSILQLMLYPYRIN